jgi:chorismate dehydratase
MKTTRISIVKYTNSLPFLDGLENHPIRKKIQISADTPAECYEKLMNDDADIGLVPVTILNKLNYADIVSKYCIATRGKVRSVILASTVPLERIEKIYLDYQSRTSVNLVKILAKKFWKIEPEFVNAEPGFETRPVPIGSAFVVIGDRCFRFYDQNYLIYDLGEEWLMNTGKPFVFACWVANKPVDPDFEAEFSEARRRRPKAWAHPPESTGFGR